MNIEVKYSSHYPLRHIAAKQRYGLSCLRRPLNERAQRYDYGARQYDPTAPRFTTPDPLAEKYYGWNAYVYCKNNPVNRIDPNGMEDYFNLNGDFIYHEGDNNDKYYVINTSLDEHEIRQSVADNNFVLAPNQDVIDKMDILFNNSDNGSKIEQGFNVYVDNELGGIQDGLENEISLVSGEGKLYDVHIHQFNGPDGKIGKAKPSDYDKDNNQYNVSIVLGYGSNTKHRQTHINDKQIGFYSNNMTKTIKYGDFKNAIQKIISY